MTEHSLTVLLWNYSDDSTAIAPMVELHLDSLHSKHIRYRRFAIDETHSNSYATWKAMGSPQTPDAAQYRQLEASGKLQLAEPPRKLAAKNGKLLSSFTLPPQSVSLVDLSW
jgi:xylan 1,4-beta-xylosidase